MEQTEKKFQVSFTIRCQTYNVSVKTTIIEGNDLTDIFNPIFCFQQPCDLLTHAEITDVVEQVNSQVEEEHASKLMSWFSV